MAADLDPRRNRILATLTNTDLEQMVGRLEPVDLDIGAVLYQPGTAITHVYFVFVGVVSLVADVGNERPVEVATVGDEGMVGLSVFLGAGPPTERATVQIAGHAVRMTADELRHSVAILNGRLQAALQRYTHAMFTQLARNTACNRAHGVRQRCARWLLMCADRMHADTFDLTQEFLAQMLGVRRATVSEVASSLAGDGCIRYRRGRITILDRDRLQAHSCECYQVIHDTLAAAYQNLGQPV